ncbi:MAG: hypothetical protein JO353_04960, partial [Phycisphaerae bacterium]|nr:hypothetical protein [Phycisphaerae bacterium]
HLLDDVNTKQSLLGESDVMKRVERLVDALHAQLRTMDDANAAAVALPNLN